jgi:23S rRNA-/tRNA-specific pseudouridylate synthase
MTEAEFEGRILARHGDLVALDKPPDLSTTGRTLEDPDCLQFHALRYFGQMVWALHQLDADTSGVCLMSLSKAWIPRLQRLWHQAETQKEYLAIVHGTPSWKTHREEAPIGEIQPGHLGVHPNGKNAISEFTVLARAPSYSLLRVRLFTGRTHQIRIHLQHLGYPLVGEEWYRTEPCIQHPRQALHAWRLQLPLSAGAGNAPLHFEAPLAHDLQALLTKLGLTTPTDHPM